MHKTIIGGLIAAAFAGGVGLTLLWLKPRGPAPETPEQLQYRLFLTTTGSGHAGKMSSGTAGKEWVGYNPWYRDGPLQVYAAQAGPHGTPRAPVFLLLQRLAPKAPYALGAGLRSDGESMEIGVTQHAADGKPFPFVWKAAGVPVLEIRTPLTPRYSETITAGGKAYSPDAGRVFLVDLTADPVTVTQVKADLGELFRGAGDEITGDEIRDVVKRLAGLEKPVGDFLEALPTP